VCVDAQRLNEEHCGRLLTADFLASLPAGVDPCGERGEYHTFVFDGPGFRRPVAFEPGHLHRQPPFVFPELLPGAGGGAYYFFIGGAAPRSHRRAVLSAPTVTIFVPCCNSTPPSTQAVWPSSVLSPLPAAGLNALTEQSLLVVNTIWPAGWNTWPVIV